MSEIFKIDKSIGRTRIFLFGKKIASFHNNLGKKIQKSIYKKYLEKYQNTQNIQREIILFDCLYDKYAEAIDTFTLFKYLQSQRVASKYFLLKENKLSVSNEIEFYKDNIIFIDKQDDLFIKHFPIIARAKYIITSFGLHTEYNKILKGLPFSKYIFIDHGVFFLKEWAVDLYNDETFDLILEPTKQSEKLYLNKSIYLKNLICSGLPRWDNLKRVPHEKKNILVFFTWRKSFENDKSAADKYMNSLDNFLKYKKLQALLERYDINLKLAIHHSLYCNKIQVNFKKINIVDTTSISDEIKKTDLLITDYSSICFDFMYLDIPVIFYRFDSNIVYKNILDLETLELCEEKDKHLYNCFYQDDIDKVINKIEYYIRNNFVLEKENVEKNKQFFYHRDGKNCERLLNYLNSTDSMAKISIIVPIYTTEKYLKKCLESLINQTYKNIEILCVDDGSQDGSLAILKEYEKKDSRIKAFMQSNAGPAAARNVGLDNMTGEYLMFCDSDDWYEQSMCEEMLYTITSKDVDVVCCNTNLVYESKGRKLREKYYQNRNFIGEKTLDNYYIMRTNVLLWNKIFKTDIIKKNNIRFPNGLNHEDDAFWYMYAAVIENIYYFPQKLYNYTIRNSSITRTNLAVFDRLKVCIYVYKFFKENNLIEKNLELICNIFNIQSNIGISKLMKRKRQVMKREG